MPPGARRSPDQREGKPTSSGGGDAGGTRAARAATRGGADLLTEPGLCRPQKYCPTANTPRARDAAVHASA